MSRYRRIQTLGGTFFFTVNLANRQSRLLVEQIALLRSAYAQVQQTHPFETIAICVLPNHLHAIWRLPQEDANYSLRWSLIKKHFSSALSANPNPKPKMFGACVLQIALLSAEELVHIKSSYGSLSGLCAMSAQRPGLGASAPFNYFAKLASECPCSVTRLANAWTIFDRDSPCPSGHCVPTLWLSAWYARGE